MIERMTHLLTSSRIPGLLKLQLRSGRIRHPKNRPNASSSRHFAIYQGRECRLPNQRILFPATEMTSPRIVPLFPAQHSNSSFKLHAFASMRSVRGVSCMTALSRPQPDYRVHSPVAPTQTDICQAIALAWPVHRLSQASMHSDLTTTTKMASLAQFNPMTTWRHNLAGS